MPLAISTELLLGGVGSLGAAAAVYAFGAMSHGSQLFGRTLIAPARPGELALTFDDGPNPAWTPRLLDILECHNVKATFFLVGSYAATEGALVRRIAEGGHLIGNHSWSHPNMAVTGMKKIREELRQTSETLEHIIGSPVRYFRPPFGGRRPGALRAARQMGMTPVMWNAMTGDWKENSSDRIVESLMRKIDANGRHGSASNVVLHDGSNRGQHVDRGASVTASDLLIERYKSTHQFVTLDKWQ
jgi:peptidoglycan/xylan/chitin deacetylase (PgdA/CDA1 family)